MHIISVEQFIGDTLMKFNKEQLQRLAEKPDNELWAEIVAMAKSHGYTLPEATPKKDDLEKIRRAIGGVEKISLTDAAKIISAYKKRK